MQPIPQKITEVSVYRYYRFQPIETPPVLTDASGTYSIGTLMTYIYYNMSLEGGKVSEPVQKGATYYAKAKTEDGTEFTTHWMYCLTDGPNPTFGATVNAVHGVSAPAADLNIEDPYIKLEPVVDLTAVFSFPPPAIGSMEVQLGKNGYLIGTRIGTPHLMGFLVEKPEYHFAVGTSDISVSAKTDRGQSISYPNLTCVESNTEQAVFLQTFP